MQAGGWQQVGGHLRRAADVGGVGGLGRDGRDAQPGEEVGQDPVALAVDPPGQPRCLHRPYATGVAGNVDDVRARLESIAEELADMALDRLREAVAAGAAKTSEGERLITRARRSVEKAAVLLGQVEGTESAEGTEGGDRTARRRWFWHREPDGVEGRAVS